jgi:hypothetical protein
MSEERALDIDGALCRDKLGSVGLDDGKPLANATNFSGLEVIYGGERYQYVEFDAVACHVRPRVGDPPVCTVYMPTAQAMANLSLLAGFIEEGVNQQHDLIPTDRDVKTPDGTPVRCKARLTAKVVQPGSRACTVFHKSHKPRDPVLPQAGEAVASPARQQK